MKSIYYLLPVFMLIVSCDDTQEQPPIQYKNHIQPDETKVISKIAFGSGCKQFRNQKFWTVIGGKNPDLWIWGGDNIYSDTESRSVLEKNYSLLKKNSYYQEFIAKIPVVGVWDDHDYGARDGGEEYLIKKESKEEFMNFFDVPSASDIRNHDGIYTSYEIGASDKKIKIYLLDNRYFKTELEEDTTTDNWYVEDFNGTVLGEEQWAWLENEINSSDAVLNIFVSGIQVIPNNHIFEKWGNFPNERKRFLDLISRTNVKNPLILSGDRHFSEYSKFNLSNNSNVFEFTSSGMTHSYDGVDEQNDNGIGDLFDGKSFGMIEIDWKEKISVSMVIYDMLGTKISSYTFELKN